MTYQLVAADSAGSLDDKVKSKLAPGWKLYGRAKRFARRRIRLCRALEIRSARCVNGLTRMRLRLIREWRSRESLESLESRRSVNESHREESKSRAA